MKSLWDELRPLLLHIAAFSFFINLLFLVPAIFTLQVFDRVITSNSQETLLVLLAGTGVALVILLLLDYVRNRLQNLLGKHHRRAALAAGGERHRGEGSARTAQREAEGIRDVAALRSVFAANGLIAVFDAPWVPVYVLVIWMFHPALGIGAALCCPRSCCSWRGSMTASAVARWMACRRMGAAPASTWRARCATRRCCRRSA